MMAPFVAAAGCGPVLEECQFDSDCGPGFVCNTNGFARCVEAPPCDTTADCQQGEICEQRPQEPPTHPFENGTPGRKVCVCNAFECSEGGIGGSF